MQDPRYAGTIAGHFRVEGAGADSATMTLKGGGRLTRADLFGGRLSDAEVSVSIAAGSLTASYDGRFTGVNPALAFDDPRIEASLSGTGSATIAVRDLLTQTTSLADYDIAGTGSLVASTARGVQLDKAEASARLSNQTLQIERLAVDRADARRQRVGIDRAGRHSVVAIRLRDHPRRCRAHRGDERTRRDRPVVDEGTADRTDRPVAVRREPVRCRSSPLAA